MYAFPAAKRTLVLMMSIALLVFAFSAQAGEDEGYLGVMLQDLTPSMAKALQLDDESGVMVNDVIDDSPAAKAGLEDGDVILKFNGKNISDNDDLVKAVRKTTPGDKVEIVVLRNGKNKNLDVEIGAHEQENVYWVSSDDDADAHVQYFGEDDYKVMVMGDSDNEFAWTADKMNISWNNDRGFMGVHLDDLNEQMGEYFGVEDGKGALVTEVVEDSPAAAAGLKAGDVIVRIGENDVDSSGGLHKALADTEPGQQMAVKVMRKGQSKDVSIELGEMPENNFTKQIKIIGDGDNQFTIHGAPHMMKHYRKYGDEDLDVEVIMRNHEDLIELHESQGDIDEMREELEKMKAELKKLQEDIKK